MCSKSFVSNIISHLDQNIEYEIKFDTPYVNILPYYSYFMSVRILRTFYILFWKPAHI